MKKEVQTKNKYYALFMDGTYIEKENLKEFETLGISIKPLSYLLYE